MFGVRRERSDRDERQRQRNCSRAVGPTDKFAWCENIGHARPAPPFLRPTPRATPPTTSRSRASSSSTTYIPARATPSTARLAPARQRRIYSVQLFREILLRVPLTPYDALSGNHAHSRALLPSDMRASRCEQRRPDDPLGRATVGRRSTGRWRTPTSRTSSTRSAARATSTARWWPTRAASRTSCPENSWSNVMAVTATPVPSARRRAIEPGLHVVHGTAQQSNYIGGPSEAAPTSRCTSATRPLSGDDDLEIKNEHLATTNSSAKTGAGCGGVGVCSGANRCGSRDFTKASRHLATRRNFAAAREPLRRQKWPATPAAPPPASSAPLAGMPGCTQSISRAALVLHSSATTVPRRWVSSSARSRTPRAQHLHPGGGASSRGATTASRARAALKPMRVTRPGEATLVATKSRRASSL